MYCQFALNSSQGEIFSVACESALAFSGIRLSRDVHACANQILMRTYSQATIQRLYGRSGNQCAFPGCNYQIITDGGQVQGRICHIKGLRPGSARYDSAQTDKQRNEYENLVLMCANHHDAIDAQEQDYTVEVLHEMKALGEAKFGREECPSDAIMARILMNGGVRMSRSNVAIHSPGAIQGHVIKITNRKGATKIQPPPGSIGADGDASRYVSSLIRLYNECAKDEPSRKRQFNFGAISRNIEDKFGARWQLLEMPFFAAVCRELQMRILNTRKGRIKNASGTIPFESFAEFVSGRR